MCYNKTRGKSEESLYSVKYQESLQYPLNLINLERDFYRNKVGERSYFQIEVYLKIHPSSREVYITKWQKTGDKDDYTLHNS